MGDARATIVRHDVSRGVCPCGSTHDWELAKHGACRCSNPKCDGVHSGSYEGQSG